jgi:hypothetical protein
MVNVKYVAKNVSSTPYTGIIQKYLNEDDKRSTNKRTQKQATFTALHDDRFTLAGSSRRPEIDPSGLVDDIKQVFGSVETEDTDSKSPNKWRQTLLRFIRISLTIVLAIPAKQLHRQYIQPRMLFFKEGSERAGMLNKPSFVFEHPYVTSTYYIATNSTKTLTETQKIQVDPKRDRPSDRERGIVSRLAIVRPFCEFDAEGLPSTFTCWNSLVPCRAAEQDLGDYVEEEDVDEWVLFDMSTNGTGRKLNKVEEENWDCEAFYSSNSTVSWFRGMSSGLFKRCKRKARVKDYFDDVTADGLRTTSADLFLFYSQTFADSPVAMRAVDEIMNEFFSPGGVYSIYLPYVIDVHTAAVTHLTLIYVPSFGGWSRCFDNIYAIEANIPPELDLYIPSAQEELYNWVNGPNRQFEAAFRIIQSGEWGDYDGFYLMEGDSVPVKNYWLDVLLGEINAYKPFAVLGA